MDKLGYLVKTFSRTKRKDYENYVLNAVWNRLADDSVKPVSQQWVSKAEGGGSGYFIDLYFPQLNIGVECDEGHHKKSREADRRRELDLIDILHGIDDSHGYRALHIDVSQDYETVERQINETVSELRGAVEKRREQGGFKPWEPECSLEKQIKGIESITVGSGIAFATKADVCNALFGCGYSRSPRLGGFIPRGGAFEEVFGDRYMLWFPQKTAVEGAARGGWKNVISTDGSEIFESHDVNAAHDDTAKRMAYEHVTFVRAKDPIAGTWGYHFLGVFKCTGLVSRGGKEWRVYQRVGTSFPIPTNNPGANVLSGDPMSPDGA